MARDDITFGKKGIFASNIIRRLTVKDSPVVRRSANDATGSMSMITANSFQYDAPGTGLKSTQQVNLDFSKFENHTFFNSAEAKINVAFDEIINYFPFDGTQLELNEFLNTLTGFEKYLYDIFPKHIGFLHFSGGGVDLPVDDANYITVKDFTGHLFPDLSKDRAGKSVLDPGVSSISFEFDLYVPVRTGARTHNQVILQKKGAENQGITVALSGTAPSADSIEVLMMVSSGSAFLSASMSGTLKNRWNHICATYNRAPGKNVLELYNDGVLQSISNSYSMDEINFKTSPLTIGTGSLQTTGSLDSAQFVPLQLLSGAIDELRVFHDVRSVDQQKASMDRNIFPGSNELKLYFKFNEATGSYDNNNVVLDSSGNSLHSRITNFLAEYRDRKSLSIPVALEKPSMNPVLFPDDAAVVDLNVGMLAAATQYDANNPNMITKLIPVHYLLEASEKEGMQGAAGSMGDAYSSYNNEAVPGGGKVPSPQIVASLLFTWAKYFDEMKIFLDQFSNLLHVDYDSENTVASQFLPFLADYYGFELPSQFSYASLEQFIEGDNLLVDSSNSANSLQYIQDQLWRRILINLNEIIRSKGTVHAIKSLMRSVGLNPDNNFRFREFGGSSTRDLTDARINKTEVSTLLDMSASLRQYETPTLTAFGSADNVPFLQSTFLSGARVEPGYPTIDHFATDGIVLNEFIPDPEEMAGGQSPEWPYQHGLPQYQFIGTKNRNDGLFTSGSWTYGAYYKFGYSPVGISHPLTQSLVRLCTTGSAVNRLDESIAAPGDAYPLLNANLIAFNSGSKHETGSLRLYVQSDLDATPVQPLVFSLNGVNIFDGDQWYVSFGRQRNDSFDSIKSSSFFIRAGKQNFGSLITYKSASMLYLESLTQGNTVFENIDQGWPSADYNASGSFIVVGSQSLGPTVVATSLNSHALTSDDVARYTKFSGKMGHTRFWSEGLSQTAGMEHARNFRSLGVDDPLTNFNFVTTKSGSFEKLRMNVTTDQAVTQSNAAGQIILTDFSQHSIFMTGSGFETEKRIIKPERFDFSMLDPKFDEGTSDNKIRIRSWQNYDNIKKFGGEVAPIYEVPASEKPHDDTRFAIEVSAVQALNEDIVNIFASLEALNNAIGAPELLFSEYYPELQNLRDVYFHRLTSNIDFKKMFEFYKWINASIGLIIESLIPRKTNFLGMNYVIESHMLERNKFSYGYADIYLDGSKRIGTQTVIHEELEAPLEE